MASKKGQNAYKLTYVFSIVAFVNLAFAFLLVFSEYNDFPSFPFFIAGGAAIVIGIICGHIALIRLTGLAGERVLFETFFPMMMSLVPLAGPFIALASAYKLLRGRLGAATITSSGGGSYSVRSYEATGLGRAGIPTGLILVMLASLQPLVAYSIYSIESQTETSPEAVPKPRVKPEPSQASLPAKIERYGKNACHGILKCYTRAEFIGQVAGKIVMPVDEYGKVTKIEAKLPNTDKAIQECIRKICLRKRIFNFDGPPGNLVCEFAGSVAGSTHSVTTTAKFVRWKKQ